MRRFVQPGAQQLRERIARLVLERELFLPPAQQLAAMLLDFFRSRIFALIEAEPLVVIRRLIFRPAVHLFRIIREWKRKLQVHLEHRYETSRTARLALACAISSGRSPVFRSIETCVFLPQACTATSSTWLSLYS